MNKRAFLKWFTRKCTRKDNGVSRFHRVFSLVVVFALGLVACSNADPASVSNDLMDEQIAIEKAQQYCAHLGEPQLTPGNISAVLLTCSEAVTQYSFVTCSEYPPGKKVWIVSMDGLWPRWRGPASLTNETPTPFNHCSVMLDADTGNKMGLIAY